MFTLEIYKTDMECVHESICNHVETLVERAHRSKNKIFTIWSPDGDIWYESVLQ